MEMFRKMYRDRFGVNPEILKILIADTEKVRAVVLHRNGKIVEKTTFTAWRGGHIGEYGE